MKFQCMTCDTGMELDTKEERGPGSLALVYACGDCGHKIAMITNAGETQLVSSLGVQIGHERLDPEPMGGLRGALDGGRQVDSERPDPEWSESAERRLSAAPSFVQGMVRRLYNDWARQHGVATITPAVMNQARDDLGLMEM